MVGVRPAHLVGHPCRLPDVLSGKILRVSDSRWLLNSCSLFAREVRAPESLNREGAMALARRLQAHWHARGYMAARFWAEPIAERFAKVGTYDIYRVVCNFVNGLPPRYRDD